MKGLLNILHIVKDYWFLIALIGSALLSIGYMVIFRVTPWDKQREVKNRKKLVSFHNQAGHSLLEGGQFQLARAEFEAALALEATDQHALNGRYLSNMFLAFEAPDWDASAGFAVQDQLTRLMKQAELAHIIEKYLGDLCYNTNRTETARQHYEAALKLRPNYPDALHSLGWFHYLTQPDLDRMEAYFKKLTEISRYDYRGFHGLGYALYMKALREKDAESRKRLIGVAAAQSTVGRDLSVNRWSIIADFGEVARSVDPRLSIFFHQYGSELLEDPRLKKVNPRVLVANLLLGTGQVRIKAQDEKRAWLTYQLALDHLAVHRLGLEPGAEESHDILFNQARALDTTRAMHPIYADQLAILDLLLPATTGSAKTPQSLHKIASATGRGQPS